MADYEKYIEKYKDIFDYIKDYRTEDLVKILLQKRGETQKKEAAKVAAAIALRNGLRTIDIRTFHRFALYHTAHLIDKVEEKWYDSSLDDFTKRGKIARYSAAIAARNGIHDDWPMIVHIAVKILKIIV